MIRIVALALLVGCGFTAQVPDDKAVTPDAELASDSSASTPIDAPADASLRDCEGPGPKHDKGCVTAPHP